MPTYINRSNVAQSIYNKQAKKYIIVSPNESIALTQLLQGSIWEKISEEPYVCISVSSKVIDIPEGGEHAFAIDMSRTCRIYVSCTTDCTLHANVKEAPGTILSANTKIEICCDKDIENLIIITQEAGTIHITEME